MRRTITCQTRLILIPALALSLCACSALQPPDAGGPRSVQPLYPIPLPEESKRAEDTLALWERLAHSLTIPDRTKIQLHPFTATIESLPPNTPLYLPKIGTAATMSEEETRESLRRFIQDWQGLIGADPNQLSLVERTDLPDATKLAVYSQHPFRYPLRGPYGNLRIRFGADRHLLEFSSTCIPNADRLQASIATINPQLTWEEATSRVLNTSVSFATGSGQQSFYQLSPANRPEPRELVIYARDPVSADGVLELHLAWEIAVTNAPVKFVYLDAVKGEIIATA